MSNPSVNKRLKERLRQDKQKEKEQKKKERRDTKVQKGPGADGVDPDIAGIIPGPQPVAEE